jgi:hypothetical protein
MHLPTINMNISYIWALRGVRGIVKLLRFCRVGGWFDSVVACLLAFCTRISFLIAVVFSIDRLSSVRTTFFCH